MGPVTIQDLLYLQSHFANKKEPTPRDKAALEKLNDEICYIAESIWRNEPPRR